MHLREVTLSLLSNVHPTTGAYLNSSRRVSRDKRDTIVSKRIIGTWIAVFAVIGVMLGSLAAASDGPLPYVQTNEVHTAPAWGWAAKKPKRGSAMLALFNLIYREYCRARLAEMPPPAPLPVKIATSKRLLSRYFWTRA
jgi:hypothetical protein